MERVAGLYEGMRCGRTFREDLEAHLLHGYVVSTPEVFVMGRAVSSRARLEEVRDPWRVFDAAVCDAWLVYALAGDVAAGLRAMPYRLPLLAWERGGRNGLRFWRTERVRGKLEVCSLQGSDG